MSEFGFKVPVSGQKIPHGWFAALVRFVNSLILSGDGTWTMVSRDEAGTQVTLTPSAVAALKKAAGGAPAAGAAQDLSVSVSGNTATVGISGSTSHVDFVGTGAVNISGNTNGKIEIDVPGGAGSYPVWGGLVPETLAQSWDASYGNLYPIILPASGYLYIFLSPAWRLDDTHMMHDVDLVVYVDNREVFRYYRSSTIEPYTSGDPVPVVLFDAIGKSAMIPVCSGSTVTGTWSDSTGDTPAVVLTLYKDIST